MKTAIAVMIASLLFYIPSPAADYSQMNQAYEAYTPPEHYTKLLEPEPVTLTSNENSGKVYSDGLSRMERLKQFWKEKINDPHEIGFLPGIDTATFRRFASLTPQQEAALVRKHLVLSEIEIIAGLKNPAVLAARKKVMAELTSFDQVMDLDENLAQYSAFTKGINTKTGPLKMKGSVKQQFPYPGVTSLKGGIVQQQVAVSVEKMRIVRKTIITETRKAYWNMVFVERSMGITLETIDAFNRLKDVAASLYKSGKTSFQDVIKISIKIEILKEDLVTLRSKKENIEVKIRELLNLPSGTRLGQVLITKAGKDFPDFETLAPLAGQNRQETKVIRHKILKVQNMVEMAESMIQEPFTLNFSSYGDEAVKSGGALDETLDGMSDGTTGKKTSFPEKTMASMKNNRPLQPWYGVDNPWLNQTKHTLQSLVQTLIEQENASNRMVRQAWFTADKNRRELALYKNRILELTKSALDVSTREYETGAIPFSQAIDAYTGWLKVKLTIARKQTDLGISVANLEKMVGISF